MDVRFFSNRRTEFIRFFYTEGRKPFDATMAAIDGEMPPYDVPPTGFDPEYGEPAYLTEWLEAEMAINVLGYSCLSMLSNSLKLVFLDLERVFGFAPCAESKSRLFKQGFLAGYKALLSEILDTDWSDCPADLTIIEQVVLARNLTQHMDDHSGFDAFYDEKTVRKHPLLFFVGGEKSDVDAEDFASWFGKRVEVTEADLRHAIDEVDKLVEYIMGREEKAYEWRAGQR